MIDDLRYPRGKYLPQLFSHKQKEEWLLDIKFLPSELEVSVQNLDAYQLETPYRPGGWTVRQLVHHVADSHINAYVRCKLALTEERPAIKAYEEKLWAELREARTAPVEVSLRLLEALHERWVLLLRALGEPEL